MVQRYWCYVTRGGWGIRISIRKVYGPTLLVLRNTRGWGIRISVRKVYGPTLLVLCNARGVGYTDQH